MVATSDNFIFAPSTVMFDGVNYQFKEKLQCTVTLEEERFNIEYEPLKIFVWGDTLKQAEEAFAFQIHGLWHNYALESDEKLSLRARKLKSKLISLVKPGAHETTKIERTPASLGIQRL